MRRAVFLDRDGVLNRAVVRDGKPYPPDALDELEILPGVDESCAKLKKAGFLLVAVSNQPDVARGLQREAVVQGINSALRTRLSLDDVRVCFHDDGDACGCRKPEPGLLLDAAARWHIDLSKSFLVGDRFKDVEAGRRAGCTTVLIGNGYGESATEPHLRVSSLEEATALILEEELLRPPKSLADLRVKIFADGADLAQMIELRANPLIAGFTTNPTLMRKIGVTDYRHFATEVLREIRDCPVSFEVFADEFSDMERQAHEIASWGDNVFVKIPVTNSQGEASAKLVTRLTAAGIHVNVTALMTPAQVLEAAQALGAEVSGFVSLFAGRVSDTGRDPMPIMAAALDLLQAFPSLELIWASPREVLNVFQADEVGCHVITVTHDLLAKLGLVGKDLLEFSLDTVKMFHSDGDAAGYSL